MALNKWAWWILCDVGFGGPLWRLLLGVNVIV